MAAKYFEEKKENTRIVIRKTKGATPPRKMELLGLLWQSTRDCLRRRHKTRVELKIVLGNARIVSVTRAHNVS